MCAKQQEKHETGEETRKRQAQNQERMASLRQSETCEQSMKRQAQNQERMASLRQSETREQSMKRQAQNQEHMASLRQSETCEQSMKRQAAVECETCIYTQPVYRNFVYSVPLCVWKVLGTCETTHGVYEFRRGFCTLVLSFCM